MDAEAAIQLADWRREIGELYGHVRGLGPEAGWEEWRLGRERLYRLHPQSPVPPSRRATFTFDCFPYDPGMRAQASLHGTTPTHVQGDDEVPGMTHVGNLRFSLNGAEHQLGAFWLDGYAGGLFVPFNDATAGAETYGGGRYVLDTAKGADLGAHRRDVVLDLNFAYAPSCAHNPQWRCPLAPAANHLAVAVRAGERG